MDAIAARQHLVDDRHYRYRGCAPDEENPRVSAGDPDVPVDAWGPYTDDGAEPQRVRLDREKAALDICGRCPVLALCRTYGNTTAVDEAGVEHLIEPEGILGGELALTRHRALIARRHAATTSILIATEERAGVVVRDLKDARTQQKRAVLAALARETDPEAVAFRAGMDLRTANWHRSALVTLLGLDREHATRDQLLAAAIEHRLIARSTRIRPDGPWPWAAAPTTDGARQRRIAPGRPVELLVPGTETMPRSPRVLAGPRIPAPIPVHRPRPPRVGVQLELPVPARPALTMRATVTRRPVSSPSTVLELA
ncbi:hypothetical protein ABZ802_31175 [Streptomyces sp. NPDC047737]|uniref:hypothetical protein n=1 Tax=Streptomyces sp. NPDC047737 TaxID=3155740 RepID=UPI0034075C85